MVGAVAGGIIGNTSDTFVAPAPGALPPLPAAGGSGSFSLSTSSGPGEIQFLRSFDNGIE